jgi:uncharacterized protein (TIGR01777 family)
MMTVLITGGTGLVGKALTKALLEKGYHVIVLSRTLDNSQKKATGLSHAQWNINEQTIDAAAVAKADYIIHLAGAGVADERWSKKRKKEIVDSRVKSGELLVKALKETDNKVKAVISASAIGWYGPDPVIPNPNPFKETDKPANDFLGQTCKQWETSTEAIRTLDKRVVIFRIGIVLSKDGGALKEFIKPLRFGMAAILGNGKQIISWIHIDDLVGLYINAIENEQLNGTYNAITPSPVSNKQLTLALAKQRNGRWFIPIPVPAFVLKIVLGEMSIEVLKSATVSSEKILLTGFSFHYPSIQGALQQLMTK